MTYPAEWEADVVLADGGTIHVRPIQPADSALIEAFHGRQSPENIYYRYFTPRPWLSPKDLERLSNVDYTDRMAFVALLGDELVGIARYDRYPTSSNAEVAFFTDGAHQGRGLATILLEYLAAVAREAGITGFVAQVLPQNRRMLSVFKKAGFSTHSRFTDGIIEVDLGIDPTPEARAAIEERARTAYARSVQRILAPSSVAVVGASRNPDAIGHQVVRRLIEGGFTGPVYPINPHAVSISSVRAYASLAEVPDDVDVAIICVPAETVLEVVAQCGHKRVRGLVIMTAGFAEAGERGAAREREVVELAHRHGMRVIGPNSMGVVNTDPGVRLDATFVGISALPGRMGVSSQSGTLGAAIIGHATRLGLGISTFVSVGNKPDVSGNDLLAYWEEDPNTDVVLLHLESFGNPRNFARITRRLTRSKPVVAVKAGRSVTIRNGPGDGLPVEASLDALLAQTGVIRVDTLEQLFDVARLVSSQPIPRGNRVAVLSNSWGPAVLAADACLGAGLVLSELSAATQAGIAELLAQGREVSGTGRGGNPIDLGYRADAAAYRSALGALLVDAGVDAVLVLCTPPVPATLDEVAEAITEVSADQPIPVVATFLGLGAHSTVGGAARGVPVFEFPEAAAHGLGRVARYGAWLSEEAGIHPDLDDAVVEAIRDKVVALQESAPGAVAASSRWLTPAEAADVLAPLAIELVPRRFVESSQEAVEAAEAIGWPVALKATGLDRPARTEAGGVAVDVHGSDEVRQAYDRMAALLGDAMRPAVVQAMAPSGVNCHLALHQHPEVGAVIVLGPDIRDAESGLSADVAKQVLPLTDADARRLVARSAVAGTLAEHDPSGQAAEELAGLVCQLGALGDAIPELATILCDPVLVSATGAFVTDVRVRLDTAVHAIEPDIRRL